MYLNGATRFRAVPVSAWVLSGFSSFLPQFERKDVGSSGNSKLTVGMYEYERLLVPLWPCNEQAT